MSTNFQLVFKFIFFLSCSFFNIIAPYIGACLSFYVYLFRLIGFIEIVSKYFVLKMDLKRQKYLFLEINQTKPKNVKRNIIAQKQGKLKKEMIE